MRLSAALLPPGSVLEDLAAVVRSVRGSDVELYPVPPEEMLLPFAHFGNVSLTDRTALRGAMEQGVAGWAPIELRFRGGSALVDDKDDSVWAELDGDIEQLAALGAAIPRYVQRLGFLIDRRVFHTRMRVARITPATTVEFLERLLARLEGYSGPAWTAHDVVLLRRHLGIDGEQPGFDVLHELPLVGDAVGAGDLADGRHRA